MVPDNSTGISRVPAYSGAAPGLSSLRLRDSHPLRSRVPTGSAGFPVAFEQSYNPGYAFRHRRFGLFPVRSPLLGESCLLSLPAGTKMFQFPAFAPPIREVPESLPVGCPIRTSAGHGAFATRRSFSQLVTSFFASESLGIPHAPFVVPFYPYPARLKASGLCLLHDKFDNVFAFDLLDCETFVSLLLSSRWFLTKVRNLASSLVIVLFQ